MKINDRACAVLAIGEQIEIFGFGTFVRSEIPEDYDVRSFSVCYKQLGIPLDYIILDESGEKVYSSECYIMHEKDIVIAGIDTHQVQPYDIIDIRAYRNNNLRALAKSFAMDAHKDQKYGNWPYIAHCYQVVSTLKEFGINNPQAEAVAWMHDILEDCEGYEHSMGAIFGTPIFTYVCQLTGKGINRQEKMQNLLIEIKNDSIPTIVKCADRITNIRNSIKDKKIDLLKMYISEHEDFMQLNVIEYPESKVMFEYLDKLVWN